MNPDRRVLSGRRASYRATKQFEMSTPEDGCSKCALKTNHDIFAEPEDHDGRETGRNPANGDKIRV